MRRPLLAAALVLGSCGLATAQGAKTATAPPQLVVARVAGASLTWTTTDSVALTKTVEVTV